MMNNVAIVIAFALGVITGGSIGTFWIALFIGRKDDEGDKCYGCEDVGLPCRGEECSIRNDGDNGE